MSTANSFARNILKSLPRTLRVTRPASVQAVVVEAFAAALLELDNAAGASKLTHWVGTADEKEAEPDDLGKIAALFGLAPRPDESASQFREHLKRYIQIFIRGTTTVPGVLRLTAELLDLRVDPTQFDYWWNRDGALEVYRPRHDDAATSLFGVPAVTVTGTVASSARIAGTVLLPGVLPLPQGRKLALRIDGGRVLVIDVSGVAEPEVLVARINGVCGTSVAQLRDGRLALSSPGVGPRSSLEVIEGSDDAAGELLGLALRTYRGNSGGAAATLTGTVRLDRDVDLGRAFNLRLRVDARRPVTIDCSGETPQRTRLEEIIGAINGACRADIASRSPDGRLVLTSPSGGTDSLLVLEMPTSDDATEVLLGVRPRTARGNAATRASVQSLGPDELPTETDSLTGNGAYDARARRYLGLGIDDEPMREIDLASHAKDPANATAGELAEAINAAVGWGVASVSPDDRLTITSLVDGEAGRVAIEVLVRRERRRFTSRAIAKEDAAVRIFGDVPRDVSGDATAAFIEGIDLPRGVDVHWSPILRLAVDGGAARDIILAGSKPNLVFVDEITTAVNAVFPGVATVSDQTARVRLTSPTVGETSRLQLFPVLHLDVSEYETEDAVPVEATLNPGEMLAVGNVGAGDTFAELWLTAPTGSSGPSLLKVEQGWGLRLLRLLAAGETVRFWRSQSGQLRGERIRADKKESLSGTDFLVGPLGIQVLVPCPEWREAGRNPEGDLTVQLNDPTAPQLVQVRSRRTTEVAWLARVRPLLTPDGLTPLSIRAPWSAERFDLPDLPPSGHCRLSGVIRRSGDGYTLYGVPPQSPVRIMTSSGINLADQLDPVVVVVGGQLVPWTRPRLDASRVAYADLPVDAHFQPADLPDGGPIRLHGRVSRVGGQFYLEGRAPKFSVELLPVFGIDWAIYSDQEKGVIVDGSLQPWAPRLRLRSLARLFDVTLRRDTDGTTEDYPAVTLGVPGDPNSLALAVARKASQLAVIQEFAKDEFLRLPTGTTTWQFNDSPAARFNAGPSDPLFGQARFPDGADPTGGIFDVSLWSGSADSHAPSDRSLYGPGDSSGAVGLRLRWPIQRAGSFTVHLPAELPPEFGGYFNVSRFTPIANDGRAQVESYTHAGRTPWQAQSGIIQTIQKLHDETPVGGPPASWVYASIHPQSRPPMGWTAHPVPYRRTKTLTLGRPDQRAAIYLSAPGIAGLLRLEAITVGEWGNRIGVAVRGPVGGPYVFEITYPGDRYESARSAVLGPEPLGLLATSAAGIRVRVERDSGR
ncbi:unnamed protein product [Gemmata massiliana]|uniref:Uncharacterized protein n=1 Tax=Gemmata massiliana TaxID=1210884 RepID=A0A6P2CXV4_9BACT|nr:hypothetical protein [Gemmata massiliana]VTR92935.1 unnamed protein product [Gemmata massiliana]